ncbi:MAG TPA: hypothetical protein ENI82_00380, partial [Bacteroidetes bacterium]|nr:hypothetical protein [Bacteroidota bacterium]
YNRLYYKLLYLAEEAKKVLTHQPIAEIEFEVKDDTGKEIDVFLELSKAQFENLIGGYIDSTVEMMKEIFSRNNLSEEEVNCILLIGGSTYIPLVKTKLREAFKIEINSSIDPSTAVVVGAAYYAGTKPLSKKIKPAPSIDQVTNNFKVKLAYERVVQDDEVLVLAKIDGAIEDLQYRITRADGGYDSGLLMLKNQLTMHLPIVENTFNSFEWSILNSFGEKIYTENIGVTHGKFSIDGQPLPHAICLEVDSIENDTTFLELVFKKNAILPLKKTITKQVSKTIRKGSTDYVIIKVLEGDVDALPAANKTIGIVRLDGMQLERDLIKGSDIDLTFEITESRDLKVNTYFSLTDQEFENTFNPSEINISKSLMLDELNSFKKNIQLKIKKFEESGNYESAGFTLELSKEIDVLIDKVNRLDENQNSDDIYRLEVKKRAMGKKIQTVFTTSFLTKAIEDYYKSKSIAEGILMTNEATEHDRMRFSKLIEHEKTLLKEGNITSIKMAVNQLDNITRTISRKQPLTSEDLLMHYIYMKHSSFKSQEKANELIRIGDHALENKNYIELHNIVNKLYILKEQDENENGDLFKNKGTGIK